MYRTIATASALIAAVRAQQVCTLTTETHPSLSWSKCTASSCTTVSGSVVVDANWRWTHTVNGSTNCYTGNEWDTSICTDGETCAEECCVDGADYESTYGVTTSGDSISLQFVTQSSTTNVGSRLYLMEDEDTYQMFTLLGNEFTFDVDVSNLGCGLNGALYFVSMDEDGGLAKYDGNKAGAKYGTGYCDSQCPRDIKFIDGVGNCEDWVPSSNDANSGVGSMGSCCAEMDIWEANDISTAFTPHPCQNNAQHSCSGDDCGGTYSTTRYAGDCDPDGCDFNSYRMGNETFYGPGSDFTLDTSSKMTVVTQFIKGSDGDLSAIKRFYVQNGKVIPNSESTITGVSGNDITSDFCTAQKTAFGDRDSFTANGGFSQMSAAVASPMVLVLSLWDDHYADMLWLDSTYPVNETGPGTARGTCSTDSGVPATIEANDPSASVIYSNIKFGPINSTFSADSTTGSSTTTTGEETTGDESSSAPAVAAATSSTKAVAVAKSTTSVAPVAAKSSTAAPVVVKSSTTPVAVKSSAAPVVVKSSTTPVAVAKTTSTTTTPAAAAATSAGSSSSGTAAHWGQCGGINWTGPTKCASGYTCTTMNPYYYQCV